MPEARRVWNAATVLGYPFGAYIQALMLSGQRRTEVSSMRWADLDLDAGRWFLKAADTKANRQHLVPLSPELVALIDAQPRFGPYVFSSDGRTGISGYSKAKARIDGLVAVDGDGDALEPWRLHDLRRTAASHMVRLGVSMEVVGRVLNHAAHGVTAQVYGLHDYEPEKRVALAKWAAEVMRVVEGTAAGKVVPIGRRK